MPTISIIVPIFNGSHYLPSFLESLANAAPRDAEVIFVDDGSSESVLDLVPNDFPAASVTKLRNERNRGYSVAVNRGFASAKGDILVQLNTDLVLDGRCIEAMVDLIETSPKVGIVGSKQIFPTTGLLRHIGMAFGSRRHRHIYSGMQANHPLSCKTRAMQIVSGSTVAMSKQVLADIGPLDERYYNTRENLDHCLKAHGLGYRNYTCADSLTYHWVGQSGPARFARAEEDNALFWAEWTAKRCVDLNRFVDEALDHLIGIHPQLIDYRFEPLSLCRSCDESILLDCLEQRWKGAGARTHHTRVLNSAHSKLWLPMEVPYRAMMNPSPYIYLVDRISQLSENRMWFEARSRIVKAEIVMDTTAVVLTTRDLLALYGTPLT
ncbi:MAG TPA: glycosyltransferase family 2 protein [Pyrinomonadaceae bacterium]|nr:glycosyltransferase family 2 protein [Pyrinomonadaceae bacterium]